MQPSYGKARFRQISSPGTHRIGIFAGHGLFSMANPIPISPFLPLILYVQHCGIEGFEEGKSNKVGEGVYVGTALDQVKDGKVRPHTIACSTRRSVSYIHSICVCPILSLNYAGHMCGLRICCCTCIVHLKSTIAGLVTIVRLSCSILSTSCFLTASVALFLTPTNTWNHLNGLRQSTEWGYRSREDENTFRKTS